MNKECSAFQEVLYSGPRTTRTGPNPFHEQASQRLLARGYRGGQHAASVGTSTRPKPRLPFERLLAAADDGAPSSRIDELHALAQFEAERLALSGSFDTPF